MTSFAKALSVLFLSGAWIAGGGCDSSRAPALDHEARGVASQSTPAQPERSWPADIRPFLLDDAPIVLVLEADQLPERLRTVFDPRGHFSRALDDFFEPEGIDWRVDTSRMQAIVVGATDGLGQLPGTIEECSRLLVASDPEWLSSLPATVLVRLILPSSAGDEVIAAAEAMAERLEAGGRPAFWADDRLLAVGESDGYLVLDLILTADDDRDAALAAVPPLAPGGVPAGPAPRADAWLGLTANSRAAARSQLGYYTRDAARLLRPEALSDLGDYQPADIARLSCEYSFRGQGALGFLGDEQPWVAEWLPDGLQLFILNRPIEGVEAPQLGLHLDWQVPSWRHRSGPHYLVQCPQAYLDAPRLTRWPPTHAASLEEVDDEMRQLGIWSWASVAPVILRAYDSACASTLRVPREFAERASVAQVMTVLDESVLGLPNSAVILGSQVSAATVEELTSDQRARPLDAAGHTVLGLTLLDEPERRNTVYTLAESGLGGLVIDISEQLWPRSDLAGTLRTLLESDLAYFHFSAVEGGTRIRLSAAPTAPPDAVTTVPEQPGR